jgi:uncharacterized protein YbbC (DUF1343 family)
MSCFSRSLRLQPFIATCVALLGLIGCSSSQPVRPAAPPTQPPIQLDNVPANNAQAAVALPPPYPVMLGIDVLVAEGFDAVKGKRIGLLTHPAGVNRRGERTIDVLRRAPGVKLVALYGPEHGINGDIPAATNVPDSVDQRTGLPVFSVYGRYRKPTKAMLKGLDAMVIDLQDIGTRSYTFVNVMKWTMESCFENNVEVIILDRPNPLGGLKVDGPLLDAKLAVNNSVGAFRVPYVHGLTIGELARMAKDEQPPGGLAVSDAVRARGKLTVIPMRGWTRAMRWPETGLAWVPTSGGIPTWEAVQGYPMVGLGTYSDGPRIDTGFRHGIGKAHIFRGVSYKGVKDEVLEKDLQALKLPGVRFQRVSALDKDGKPATGIYIEITDYDEWRPTELNFYLMKLACKYAPKNPFAPGPGRDFSGFLHHMGSNAFFAALQHDGARIDVDAFLRDWAAQAKIYQQQSRMFWLYN